LESIPGSSISVTASVIENSRIERPITPSPRHHNGTEGPRIQSAFVVKERSDMRSLAPAITAFTLALAMLSPVTWSRPPDAKPELVGQVRVDLKGLDLQDPADARTLLTRIEKAAYRACGGNPKFAWSYDSLPVRTVEVYELCRESAIRRAIDQIGVAQLAQMYEEQRRASPTTADSSTRPR
jgi:UrcA family protein